MLTLPEARRSVEDALNMARQAREDATGHGGEVSEVLRIAIFALSSAHTLLLMEDAWQRQPDRAA